MKLIVAQLMVLLSLNAHAQWSVLVEPDTSHRLLKSTNSSFKRIAWYATDFKTKEKRRVYTTVFNRKGQMVKKIIAADSNNEKTKQGLVKFKYAHDGSLTKRKVFRTYGWRALRHKTGSLSYSMKWWMYTANFEERADYGNVDFGTLTFGESGPCGGYGYKSVSLRKDTNAWHGTVKGAGSLANGWHYESEGEFHECVRQTEIDSVLRQFRRIPTLHDSDLANRIHNMYQLMQQHGAYEYPEIIYKSHIMWQINYPDTQWIMPDSPEFKQWRIQGLDTLTYTRNLPLRDKHYKNWKFPFYLLESETKKKKLILLHHFIEFTRRTDSHCRLKAEYYYAVDVGDCLKEYFYTGSEIGFYTDRGDSFLALYDTLNHQSRPSTFKYEEEQIDVGGKQWQHQIGIQCKEKSIDTVQSYLHILYADNHYFYCTIKGQRAYLTRQGQDSFEHVWFDIPWFKGDLEAFMDSLPDFNWKTKPSFKTNTNVNQYGRHVSWEDRQKEWADVRPYRYRR